MPSIEEMKANLERAKQPDSVAAMKARVAAPRQEESAPEPAQKEDPLDKLPPSLKFVAGMFGRRKVIQDYIGRTTGQVSKEEQAKTSEVMSLLKEHGGTAFNTGDFVAQEVALAPVGLFGKGARAVSAGVKAKRAAKAKQAVQAAEDVTKQTAKISAKKNKQGLKQMKEKLAKLEDTAETAAKASKSSRLKAAGKGAGALAAPTVVSGVEGGIAGGLAAGEGNRVQGAVQGAATGTALTAAAKALGRPMRGIVKKSEDAQKLQDSLPEDATRIPLLQASGTGAGASLGRGLFNIGTWASPTARRKMAQQSEGVWDDIYKKHLTDAAPPGAKGLDDAKAVIDKSGDQRKALDIMLSEQAPPAEAYPNMTQREVNQINMTPNQRVLNNATPTTKLGRYSGDQLAQADVRAARQQGLPDSAGPMREEAELIQNVMGQAPHARGVLGDPYSRGRPTPRSEVSGAALSSPHFQNWLMGDTKHQQAWKRAVANRDESMMMQLLNLYRNTVAAEAGGMGAEG